MLHLGRHHPPRVWAQGEGGLGLSTFPRPSCFRFQPLTPHRTEGSLWLHGPTLSLNAGLGPGGRGAIHPTAAPTAALGCTQRLHPWGISEREFTTPPVLEPHRCPSTAISAAAGCLACGRTASPALFTGPPHEAPTCPASRAGRQRAHLSCSSVVLCHRGPRKRTQDSFQQGHYSRGPGERGAPTGPQLLGSGCLRHLCTRPPATPITQEAGGGLVSMSKTERSGMTVCPPHQDRNSRARWGGGGGKGQTGRQPEPWRPRKTTLSLAGFSLGSSSQGLRASDRREGGTTESRELTLAQTRSHASRHLVLSPCTLVPGGNLPAL